MRRLVLDTSVFLDWLNAGRHEETVFSAEAVKYLSAVVMMELRAGALTTANLRGVASIERVYSKTGRIVSPSQGVWADAGMVLALLQTRRGYSIRRSPGIANDVLIALTGRAIGATVVTANRRDFEAIRSVRRFDLTVLL